MKESTLVACKQSLSVRLVKANRNNRCQRKYAASDSNSMEIMGERIVVGVVVVVVETLVDGGCDDGR